MWLVLLQALRKLNDYGRALVALQEAHKLQPCDVDIAKEMKELEE